jgi:hypothetical protein
MDMIKPVPAVPMPSKVLSNATFFNHPFTGN